MPGPPYITRSYGGGAVVAQLAEQMGSTDISFAISPVTGWVDENGSPLGTTGPFVVVIDRFTASVEKILCASINLTTGVVTVYTSTGFNGRGYDGTQAQAHVPGGSTSGVQTCWSSVEAFEANAAVSYVLGTAGGTQVAGQVMTWSGTAPEWAVIPALGANPVARMHQTVAQSITQDVVTAMTNMTSDFAAGGMTFASNLFTVTTAGYYQCTGSVAWANSNPGVYGGQIMHNGTAAGTPGLFNGTPSTQVNVLFSDVVHCALNDTLGPGAYQALGGPASTTTGSFYCTLLSEP